MNNALKKFDNGRFAGVLEYHREYFKASAWMVLGIDRFKKAKEEGSDMGIAAGTANYAFEVFKKAGAIIPRIPADYHENYKKKLEQSQNMSKMATDKATTVFFEKIPEWSKIPIPDSKNFVKFDDSCKDDFNKVPPMNETLRHVVPPEVRNMQGEIKTQLQNQIDQEYKASEKSDIDERAFLG